jgi:hypothetical protein
VAAANLVKGVAEVKFSHKKGPAPGVGYQDRSLTDDTVRASRVRAQSSAYTSEARFGRYRSVPTPARGRSVVRVTSVVGIDDLLWDASPITDAKVLLRPPT